MDWMLILVNSAWILGLAIILAAAGYAHWQASQLGAPLLSQLGSDWFRKAFFAGLLLVSLGLIGTGRGTLELALAVALLLGSVAGLLGTMRTASPSKSS